MVESGCIPKDKLMHEKFAPGTSWEGLLNNDAEAQDDSDEDLSEQDLPNLVTRELEKYLKLKNINLNSNPLQWWCDNANMFPKLSKIANISVSTCWKSKC